MQPEQMPAPFISYLFSDEGAEPGNIREACPPSSAQSTCNLMGHFRRTSNPVHGSSICTEASPFVLDLLKQQFVSLFDSSVVAYTFLMLCKWI